ncbi:MAG: dTMP kinase [Candidatus Sericytochromatia bacterium]|nr:dTMP kinase [Candidatus Sericytochromatia bacterium]
MRGFFITLEGPEGAGKSSQLHQLAAWLEVDGYTVVTTKNPGGTPIGGQIREILLKPANRELVPLAELLLYAADRAQHVETVVRPALAQGSVVLCDRFTDSTLAYQGFGRGLDQALIGSLNQLATGGQRPDLTLLLDLAPEIGLERIVASRQVDRLEVEAIAFHHRLRAGYLALAQAEPERFVVVDASASPSEVQAALRTAIAARLGVATGRS